MVLRCPKCGREYDLSSANSGKRVICECGEIVSSQHHTFLPPEDQRFLKRLCRKMKIYEEEQKLNVLKRAAERVCSLILHSDYSQVDIEIEKEKVRKLCEELFPEKARLYDMIYEARFRRLWEQFRGKE